MSRSIALALPLSVLAACGAVRTTTPATPSDPTVPPLAAAHVVPMRAGEAGVWPFTPSPDTFSPTALLDLRSLNERVAGETGFVHRSHDGNSYVRGDGTPIRFWAVFDDLLRTHPQTTDAELDAHARFLAKRGVNMVRVFEDPGSSTTLDGVDSTSRLQLWRIVAAMKKQGIYVFWTPVWMGGNRTHADLGFLDSHNGKWCDLLFQHRLQQAFQSWMRQTLTEPNPYTGIPLAQDPALAIIMVASEDSLLFWTSMGIKGAGKQELRRQFHTFLESKYGHLTAAPASWQGAVPTADQDAPDDFVHGEAGLHIVWELTQHRGGPGEAARCADEMAFLTTTQQGWYTRITDYLRHDLGCHQLIDCGNWRTADDATMLDAERWSYQSGDLMAINRYYTGIHQGPNCGWAICDGDTFTDASVLTHPRCLPIALKEVEGYPMLVPESSWVAPLSHLSEGPFLIAAYGALSGVGPYVWYATAEPGWATVGIDKANGILPSQSKWMVNTPMVMGQWPAAAVLYRGGYLTPGQPAVRERRCLADFWQRRMPRITEDEGYDPNRDQGLVAKLTTVTDGIDPLAYEVGPVRVSYGADTEHCTSIDLAPFIDRSAHVVRSDTLQLRWDYGHGFCTMDAPLAQGASGSFAAVGGQAHLHDLAITCANPYATVLAVSLDAQPLAVSGRVLVQVGTRARATGWRTKPCVIAVDQQRIEGEQVVSSGHAPWLIEDAAVTIALTNDHLASATALDANGMAMAAVPLMRSGPCVRVRFPSQALYLLLRSASGTR